LYKENEDYHNIKENAIWTGFTLYISFSIVSFVWLFNNPTIINTDRCLFLIFLSSIAFSTVLFIHFQNWNKVRSTEINNQMKQILAIMDNAIKYDNLAKCISWPNNKGIGVRISSYFKDGYIGILLMIVVVFVTSIQIFYISNH